jgi:hypothetical protein
MRYILMIYSQETAEGPPADQIDSIRNGHWSVMQEASQKGVLAGVERLKPTTTATTVRVQNGSALTTDGPFAETKEQLAGYYIMECKDLDEAIEWAKKIPSSCRGSSGCIEIRPIYELERRP